MNDSPIDNKKDIEDAIAQLVGSSVAAQIQAVQAPPKKKTRKKRKTKSYAARTRAANQRKTQKRQKNRGRFGNGTATPVGQQPAATERPTCRGIHGTEPAGHCR